eukprot:TRINITY_DN10736_c0_g1_i1.p1 TRINITY_DN10736_c0_g1~~TRINITY_DN10736_c0_g1_i1.p1  ORF type:complete len:131 (+),score=19.15 TRINITY_DN10736_c0_g1_i1:275-667(+)
MLTGEPPFFKLIPQLAMFSILPDDIKIPESASPELVDFLSLCFERDPSRRKSATDLVSHPWLAPKQRFYPTLRVQAGCHPAVAVAAARSFSYFWRLCTKQLDETQIMKFGSWKLLESTKAERCIQAGPDP